MTISGFYINRNIPQVLFYVWFCFTVRFIQLVTYISRWVVYLIAGCAYTINALLNLLLIAFGCFQCEALTNTVVMFILVLECHSSVQWSISMNETALSYGSYLFNFKETDQLFQHAILSSYQQCFRSLVFYNLTKLAAVNLWTYSHSRGRVVVPHRGLPFIL